MGDEAASEPQMRTDDPFAGIAAQILAEIGSGKIRRTCDIESERQARHVPGRRVTNVLRGLRD